MWTFIFAGVLYLTGVAVILVIKPSFMFTPDGNWKEFGIGKNDARYTPFTFWLFCLVWAFISYILVLLISPIFERDDYSTYEDEMPTIVNNRARKNKRNVVFSDDSDLVFEDELPQQQQLPKGYYVLNRKASKIAGVPKYVYLGEEQP
jgi:hypothetical protein